MTFGGQVVETEAAAMFDYALDQGINFVDTSNNYAATRSETIVGKLIQGRRDKVVLASKVFNKVGDAPDQKGLSHRAIMRAIDESLSRLKTDYLDIYYLHAPDYETSLEESLKAMDALVRSGKVRYIGVSNYASWQLTRLLWIADKEGIATISIAQPMYNLLARGIEQEVLPACRELGVSTIAYNPLSGGLLTGKHQSESAVEGSRLQTNPQYINRYWNADNHQAVSELSDIARECGQTIIGLSLNWLLHHTNIDAIIVGASNLDHLKTNHEAIAEGPLTPDALASCDQIWKSLRGDTPIYNR